MDGGNSTEFDMAHIWVPIGRWSVRMVPAVLSWQCTGGTGVMRIVNGAKPSLVAPCMVGVIMVTYG